MDRGAWRATFHGVARVRHNLATKPPPRIRNCPSSQDPHRKQKQKTPVDPANKYSFNLVDELQGATGHLHRERIWLVERVYGKRVNAD